LPAISSTLPGPCGGTGRPASVCAETRADSVPICACTGKAVAVPGLSPALRWALTPPFHPCRGLRPLAVCSLLPAPRVAPGGRYPHPLPCGGRTFLRRCGSAGSRLACLAYCQRTERMLPCSAIIPHACAVHNNRCRWKGCRPHGTSGRPLAPNSTRGAGWEPCGESTQAHIRESVALKGAWLLRGRLGRRRR
jgi:hypothetical protein